MISTAIALLGVAILFSLAFWLTIKNLLYICGPNEVLVFAGGHSVVDNRRVGYRIVKGGMSIRKPLVERVSRMERPHGAYGPPEGGASDAPAGVDAGCTVQRAAAVAGVLLRAATIG